MLSSGFSPEPFLCLQFSLYCTAQEGRSQEREERLLDILPSPLQNKGGRTGEVKEPLSDSNVLLL